jgi:uncharacterized repeat protein (TIGR04138 family)
MPQSDPEKTIEQIAAEAGTYPPEAYEFVQRGLQYTAEKLHGEKTDPNASRHINGQQLSEGLRDFALLQWGLLAKTVLSRWNILGTEDFGRIVFLLVENRWMAKTDQDSLDDFKNVYDFAQAFEQNYRIDS